MFIAQRTMFLYKNYSIVDMKLLKVKYINNDF